MRSTCVVLRHDSDFRQQIQSQIFLFSIGVYFLFCENPLFTDVHLRNRTSGSYFYVCIVYAVIYDFFVAVYLRARWNMDMDDRMLLVILDHFRHQIDSRGK